jgi:hypothetical protein
MDTQAFFPANRQLPGDRDGGHDGDRGPLWSAPSSPLASPWWWAKAMPPLRQYFSRMRKTAIKLRSPKSENGALGTGVVTATAQSGSEVALDKPRNLRRYARCAWARAQ